MKEFVRNQKLMGTAFSLGVIARTITEAHNWLDLGINEIKRIESVLSEYNPLSITSKINNSKANVSVELPKEVFDLIKRSSDISELTKGAFDITTGSLKRLYIFKKETFVLPNEEAVANALEAVGMNLLQLDDRHNCVTKLKEEMYISFNAIGKGYAADCVKKIWLQNGVQSGFVNASGDLCAFGKKVDETNWNIGIANPDKITEPLLHLNLQNQSIATSGNYEQYFMSNGKRYSHNLSPFTGKPLSGLKSVSVVSPSAELSDALATAMYVMGKKKGIKFCNQLPHTHCLIIDDNNHIFLSEKLQNEKKN